MILWEPASRLPQYGIVFEKIRNARKTVDFLYGQTAITAQRSYGPTHR